MMAEESFDVVDENDRVVGRRTRSDVHRLKLLHRSVHVLVFNRSGQVFLQKRSTTKDEHPGVWDASISGHVDAGETYDACAVREACEELGLILESAPQRLFKINACIDTGYEFTWVYRVEAEGPFTLHTEEIERGGWFAVAQVDAWVATRPEELAPPLCMIWRQLRYLEADCTLSG